MIPFSSITKVERTTHRADPLKLLAGPGKSTRLTGAAGSVVPWVEVQYGLLSRTVLLTIRLREAVLPLEPACGPEAFRLRTREKNFGAAECGKL